MNERSAEYSKGSLSLLGTIAMGTGVMIGAGIFALTGQVAELAGGLFPIAFIVAAVISGFSAYSYIKVASAYPSAGGIAMILKKAYGETTVTGAAALLMALSMIINESLVARTFGTYTLQLFPSDPGGIWVPVLAVGLIIAAFLVNIAGNKVIGTVLVERQRGRQDRRAPRVRSDCRSRLWDQSTDQHRSPEWGPFARDLPRWRCAGDPRVQGVHHDHQYGLPQT